MVTLSLHLLQGTSQTLPPITDVMNFKVSPSSHSIVLALYFSSNSLAAFASASYFAFFYASHSPMFASSSSRVLYLLTKEKTYASLGVNPLQGGHQCAEKYIQLTKAPPDSPDASLTIWPSLLTIEKSLFSFSILKLLYLILNKF